MDVSLTPAHELTAATFACAERGTHACPGWLHGIYGLLPCDCWCHRTKEADRGSLRPRP